jgi:hypothetical protein
VYIDLPNGSGIMHSLLKETIHTPEMAFTLISISKLDKAQCAVTFDKGICMIKNLASKVMATIPKTDGLYRLPIPQLSKDVDYANMAQVKMMIQEAHCKFSHIAHAAIKHAVTAGK